MAITAGYLPSKSAQNSTTSSATFCWPVITSYLPFSLNEKKKKTDKQSINGGQSYHLCRHLL